MGHPKVEYFSLNFALGVALGPSWRQAGAQSAPRRLQRSIFQEVGTIRSSNSSSWHGGGLTRAAHWIYIRHRAEGHVVA